MSMQGGCETDATLLALASINRWFYSQHAREFGKTRQAPWSGWKRVVGRLEERGLSPGPLRVLDLGCGNGRFLRYLASSWTHPIEYLGVDLAAPPGDAVKIGSRRNADSRAPDAAESATVVGQLARSGRLEGSTSFC